MKKIFYITGADGSGKTTYINLIRDYLESEGEEVTHIWSRSPKILSKPLMAYCRVVGLTEYFYKNDIRYGGHKFHKSKVVSHVYPILQLIDLKLKFPVIKRKLKSANYVVMDRFSLDTLADLMVDTRRMDLHNSWIGKKFIKMIPERAEIVVLKAHEDIIRRRKKDTKHDPALTRKIEVYDILAQKLGLKVINNNRKKETVKKDLFEYFDLT